MTPQRRLRRLRRSPALRRLVRETRLSAHDLVLPLFIAERAEDATDIQSMPGVRRHTVGQLQREIHRVAEHGLQAVLLFGIPAHKDAGASAAAAEDGVIPQAIQCIKRTAPEVAVITDVCLCGYTDHGHCGLLREGRILNDDTVDLLGRVAAAHARAGADVVAPSAMLDGMVAGIRGQLDECGLSETAVLSYAVKYASAFYGPFREAADCAPRSGDRRGHQMDPANAREALAEARTDWNEGADLLMVKPGLPYLDVIRALREHLPQVPLAAYQVSGEYAMIKAASERGWLDERQVALEALTALKRAGADVIITYHACQAVGWIADAQD